VPVPDAAPVPVDHHHHGHTPSPPEPVKPVQPDAAPAPVAPPPSDLPKNLGNQDMVDGLKPLHGQILDCNKDHFAGTLHFTLNVSADGEVTDVTGDNAEAIGGCVQRVLRGAHFRKTQRPTTFHYPYTFR
jgi:hypothetical protein